MAGKLFVKIFLGFWLVTITILGSWMLTSYYFESTPTREIFEHRRPGPPHRFMLRMIYQLQNLGREELGQLVAQEQQQHGVTIFLVNQAGEDLFGRPVPQDVGTVAAELDGPRRRATGSGPGGRLLAHDIYRREEGPLRAVFLFPAPTHSLLGLLGSHLWLRIGAAVLISGLVCYGLSRMLTMRLKALQLAARRLATGDLDARLHPRERGGDETDELGRDFNSMAQQLQERMEAQKRLLADVSHELRSPLARLRVALALAQEEPRRVTEQLQRIERESERLEQLVDQLLASQAGELAPDSHVDLVPLLQQLCSDANFEGGPRGKQVVLECSIGQAIVASAGDLLHKSLENILRNALGHTPDNSRVRVTLEADRQGYRICVADQGPGVPEAELGRIFEAFYRADLARSRDTGGHGLGLAIARRAVLRHGGEIEAANTGTGLAVTVWLPAHGRG